MRSLAAKPWAKGNGGSTAGRHVAYQTSLLPHLRPSVAIDCVGGVGKRGNLPPGGLLGVAEPIVDPCYRVLASDQ